jgi:hypothetical protein
LCPHFGQGRREKLRLHRSTFGFGRSSTRVIPSVPSATYSPGPAIVILLGEIWTGKIEKYAQYVTINPL